MNRKYWLILLSLFIAPALLFAENVPQPQGWVNDFANVISGEYREKLTTLIQELEEKTSAEIAVVTVESISPYDEKEYVRLLFDSWKPGKKGKDNGVLVLLAVKDRAWRIETGYGIEGILPDGVCGEIGRNYMVPYFKERKYGEGLYYGVSAIAKTISKDAKTDINKLKGIRSKKRHEDVPLFLYFFALIFFFIWNLPWPFIIGFPVTLLFALIFFHISSILGVLVIIGYIGSLIVRYNYWRKIPPEERRNFFSTQSYGGTHSGYGGGYGGFGGGGGGGFGGFGGGFGGGGGAGGRF